MGFTQAGLERLHWGLIAMQHPLGEQMLCHRLHQWEKSHTTLANPAAHTGAGDEYA